MSVRSDNRGFTLVELLIAATLMLLILGAVLTTMDRYSTSNRRNQSLTDDTDRARIALDLVARDARNASAYQTTANATATSVLRADPNDFVFKTVDPAATPTVANAYGVRSVRYCVTAAPQRLLRQTHADVAVPATGCPDASWTTADSVSFVANGARSLFSYDSVTAATVTRVGLDLYVDGTPGKLPVETPLHSGVFLRNANRSPSAAFTAVAAPNLHVSLNGSSSLDPDGGVLSYTWKDGTTVLAQTGPVVDYVAATAGSHTFTLTVVDRGGLSDTTQQTVTVQS